MQISDDKLSLIMDVMHVNDICKVKLVGNIQSSIDEIVLMMTYQT